MRVTTENTKKNGRDRNKKCLRKKSRWTINRICKKKSRKTERECSCKKLYIYFEMRGRKSLYRMDKWYCSTSGTASQWKRSEIYPGTGTAGTCVSGSAWYKVRGNEPGSADQTIYKKRKTESSWNRRMALGTDRNRTGVAGIKFCEKEETDKKLPLGAVFYLSLSWDSHFCKWWVITNLSQWEFNLRLR